ncbi:MAG: NAD(P)H-hydrate dehydratase [Desulfobacteraceae bacterium]
MVLVTAQEMQQIDKITIETFGIPGQVLMENAGRGALDMLKRHCPELASKKVAILAGRGNNGGDGFVMARYLAQMGVAVKVFLFAPRDKVRGDARANLTLLVKLEQAMAETIIVDIPDSGAFSTVRKLVLDHDLFVDALLGTGLSSDVRGLFKEVIETINTSRKPVFSVDIPSGLDADTGKEKGVCLQAFATATFGLVKIGLVLDNHFSGSVENIDIGIPPFVVEKIAPTVHELEKPRIEHISAQRNTDAHKGSFGHLFVLAGSPGRTGAAALCANAAMRCGTGLVTLGIPKCLNSSMEPQVCEAMTLPLDTDENDCLSAASCLETAAMALSGKSAMAMGPGLGTGRGTADLVEKMVKQAGIPLVLDADALNCIAQKPDVLKEKQAPVLVTPHPGEMARLMKTTVHKIQKNRIKAAKEFAGKFDVIVLLKGAKTVIALPGGEIFINTTGNPGMASGGMGDVLTGITAGFAAQGFPLEDAALAGAYLHGACGDVLARQKGSFGFLASDMVTTIPEVIHQRGQKGLGHNIGQRDL